MRRIALLAVVALLLAAWTGSAVAWSLKMKGETAWRYRYLTRMGDNDLFGNVATGTNRAGATTGPVHLGINQVAPIKTDGTWSDVEEAGGIIVAGEERWGSDLAVTDWRATVYPSIKVNKAIKLSGSVNLTSLGIHAGGKPMVEIEGTDATGANNDDIGGYVNSLWVPINNRMAGANVPNMFVTLQWWKASIKTPMLDFSIGTKTSGVGIGIWKSKCQRASTSFGVKAKYGPLTFATSPYMSRANSDWDDFPRMRGQDSPYRKDDNRDYFRGVTAGLKYKSGPLEIALVSDSHTSDQYSAPQAAGTRADDTARPENADQWVYDVDASVKYFNGRFFFNAEAAYFWEDETGRAMAADLGGGVFQRRASRSQRAWIYGGDMGVVVGPSKLTVSYVRATGDDPSTREDTEEAGEGDAGWSSCYNQNWAYLMYYWYGGGSGFNAAGEGTPSNIHHLGARLDYAVASNLNIFGVYSYAWRDQPNAYRLGGNQLNGFELVDNDDLFGLAAGAAPYVVPDHAREIGWEVDAGYTWQLLENLTWTGTFAYWQPGTFWSFALPNTVEVIKGVASNAAYAASPADAQWGLGREIDPLFAFESQLLISF